MAKFLNNLWRSLRQLFLSISDTILPRCCRACGKSLGPNDKHLCPLCWRTLQASIGQGSYCLRCGACVGQFTESKLGCNRCRNFRLRYERLIRVGQYQGPLAQIIRALKFRRQAHNAGFLAELLSQAFQGADPADGQFDLITWVPLHWWRRWLRGYNQSALIARRLIPLIRRPAMPLLRRTRWTAPQTHLSRQARLANVRGAFALRRIASLTIDLTGKRILLIDDVLTTGATASECAGVLCAAGARVSVAVAAVAGNF